MVLRNPTAVWDNSHTSERHYHPHILEGVSHPRGRVTPPSDTIILTFFFFFLEGSTASLTFTLISLNFRHEGT